MATSTVQKGQILSISIAHMFNDWYMNFIQTLLPFIVALGIGIEGGFFNFSIYYHSIYIATGLWISGRSEKSAMDGVYRHHLDGSVA